MDMATMTAPSRHEAREAFLEYRHAVQESYAKEHAAIDERRADVIRRQREADEAIMAGYSAIARGKQVIDLRGTIAAGGLNKAGLPAIALAHAPLEGVSVALDRDGAVTFDNPDMRGRARSVARFHLPDGTLPRDRNRGGSFSSVIRAQAIVPTIPPRLRPTASLDRFWVLFEATYEQPPVDPALLRMLGSGLAVVLATWDLTPLERAVLGIQRS